LYVAHSCIAVVIVLYLFFEKAPFLTQYQTVVLENFSWQNKYPGLHTWNWKTQYL